MQPNNKLNLIPAEATNLEVFAMKTDENGDRFAYIGYKLPNGNFDFITVPFTEPLINPYIPHVDLRIPGVGC
jgi:hypothetical protein